MATQNNRSANRSKRRFFVVALLVLLTAGAVYLLHQQESNRKRYDEDYRLLTAKGWATCSPQGKSDEVHAPFRMWRGWIVVKANMAGRMVDCMLDTGSCHTLWPRSLRLPGRQTEFKYARFYRYPGAQPQSAQWIVLPTLQLGGYTVHQYPTIAYGSENAEVQPMPMLGCSLFAHAVITIDHQQQILIFRQNRDDVNDAQRRCPDCINLAMPRAADPVSAPMPLVAGVIADHPVRFLLDTGAANVNVALTNERIINAVKGPLAKEVYYDRIGAAPAVDGITWSVGSSLHSDEVDLLPGFIENADALLGQRQLRSYRITIDDSHSKVILEWRPVQSSMTRIKECRKIIRRFPNNSQAHRQLATALREAGHYPQACHEYRMALQLNPNSDIAYYGLGRSLVQMHRYKEAAAALRKVLELSPNELVAQVWYGRVLNLQGQRNAARAEWQKVIDRDKSSDISIIAQRLLKKYPNVQSNP